MYLNQNEEHHYAIARFESMLKTNDILFFDSNEFESIIYHYLGNGNMALAKKAVKLGREQHPLATALQLFHIEILIFEDKLELADSMLNQLHDIEPSNEEVYIQKANVLSKRDRHEEAIRTLEIALENTADEADVHSLIAMEYMFLEDFENAKYNYMKCLEADEEDSAALYNIIYCFDFLGQRQEAIDYLNLFLNKNPYSEVAWHQVGLQYYRSKKYKKALAAFDFAIISEDSFIGAYLEKGKVLEKLKRYNEAIENFQITLKLDDPTAFAYLRIGKCFEKLGNRELSLKNFSKAVHEDPLLDKAWIAITDFYFREKNYKKALYYINKAIGIDEENVLYWKRYAKINNRLECYKEAAKGYRKSLELGNYELETWITRCDLLIGLDHYEPAAETMQQAREFYPETSEIEYRLSGIYFTLNQAEKGYFHLKKALRIDPEYALVMEELFPALFSRKSIQQLIAKYER